MNDDLDVIVVGGGLAGLLVACEVSRRGGRPLVLEAAKESGGVAGTIHENGFTLEPAAGSLLLPNPHLTPILDSAGATVVPAEAAARRRHVYDRGQLFELAGPGALASRLVTAAGKLRILREPWIRPDPDPVDESLAGFLERRLGPEVGRLGATLMAHGVFAGDPYSLSAMAAFPALVNLERESGSIVRGVIAKVRSRPKGAPRASVHVPPDGMSTLAAELAAHLGDRHRSNWPVRSIEHEGEQWLVRGPEDLTARSVVVALAPHAAARLVPEPVASVLSEADSAPVAVVGMGGRSADVPVPNGFGALTGPDAGVHTLGLLFESSYAPNRSPDNHRLLKAILGGAADPAVLELNDSELVDLAVAEAGEILGVAIQPSWTKVVRHDPGIPQYRLNHPDWLDRLDDATGSSGLHLTGWAYRGIGVSSLAKHAVDLASIVLSCGDQCQSCSRRSDRST